MKESGPKAGVGCYATFQERNFRMVNHIARVIAICNGESGGTHKAIEYATGAQST